MNKRENNKVTKRRVPRAEISKQMKGGPDEENITETTPSLAPNPSNKPTNFFIKNRAIIGFIITGVVAITLVLCYFSFNPSPAPEIRNQADSEVASFYPPQPRKLPEDKTQISSAPDFTDQVSKSQTLYNLEKFPIAGLIQSKDGESKFGCYATPVDCKYCKLKDQSTANNRDFLTIFLFLSLFQFFILIFMRLSHSKGCCREAHIHMT